jgi:hypothetical protein
VSRSEGSRVCGYQVIEQCRSIPSHSSAYFLVCARHAKAMRRNLRSGPGAARTSNDAALRFRRESRTSRIHAVQSIEAVRSGVSWLHFRTRSMRSEPRSGPSPPIGAQFNLESHLTWTKRRPLCDGEKVRTSPAVCGRIERSRAYAADQLNLLPTVSILYSRTADEDRLPKCLSKR